MRTERAPGGAFQSSPMTARRNEKAYEKYAWVLLFVSSALFLPTSAFFVFSFFVMPYVTTPGDLSQFLASSPSIATWIRGIFRDAAIAQLGLGIFGMTIAAVSYRRGERWAWYTMWYLPLGWLAYLVTQILLGRRITLPILLLIISLLGLLLPVRRFFSHRPVQSALKIEG